MMRSWRRMLLAATLSMVAGTAGLAVSGPAHADAPEAWSLSLTGEAGDPITGGRSYSYSSDAPVPVGEEMNVRSGANGEYFGIEFWHPEDNIWSLTISAPDGETLKPGDSYENVGPPGEAGGPGITLYNGSRPACSQSIGSFTVVDVAWGPFGYVERLDATFSFRCAGATGGSRGEVHIANPPPVPALDGTLTVAPDGTVTQKGIATVHGTITCTREEVLSVSGELFQEQKKAGPVRAHFSTQVPCTPGREVPWSASTQPHDNHLERGTVNAVTRLYIRDFVYWNEFTITDTSTITLTR